MQLGTDFILDALVREGANYLFMVPGGLIDPFLPALGRQKALTPIIAAQEGGAAYMADGYARGSGNFGAVLCIGGPGLANTVTAVAAAQTDGSPVLSSAARSAASKASACFKTRVRDPRRRHDLKPIVRYSSSVHNPRSLPHIFRHAILLLRTPPAARSMSCPPTARPAKSRAICKGRGRPDNCDPLSLTAAKSSLRHFLRGRRGAGEDRNPGRRGRRARPCGAGAARIRRAVGDSGRHDFEKQGRASPRITLSRSASSAMPERIIPAWRCWTRRSTY